MRVAAWVFVLCSVLGAIALFLPSLEVQVGGHAVKRSKLSLYQASTKREFVAAMFARYHKLPGRGLGIAAAGALIPKVGHVAGDALDDAKSAAETLDDVSDADVGLGGKVLVALVWIMLALHVLAAAQVGGQLMSERIRGRRIAIAAVLGTLAAACAIGVHLVCRAAVFEANDEIGATWLALASGQYLMIGAAIGGLAALIATCVLVARHGRRVASATAA